MYWPGINSQIEEVVTSCTICSTHQRSNPKKPLHPHEAPHRPWEKVGADLFELNRKQYLVPIDYYSNFVEVEHLSITMSEQVIEKCKSQFSSETFRLFAQAYQFQHKTSSPYHPQSNGKAERTVQTVLERLKKKTMTHTSHCSIIEIHHQVESPAQQLMGRRTKTLLPTSITLLKPKTVGTKTVTNDIKKRQQQQKHYYDRQTKPLSSLCIGEDVLVQSGSGWTPAVVTGVAEAPRSYMVTTQEGRTYIRNRKHITKSLSTHTEYNDDEDLPVPSQDPATPPNDVSSPTESGPSGPVPAVLEATAPPPLR